jgi:hypothetical protein
MRTLQIFCLVQPSKVIKISAPPKISMAAKKRVHTVASGGAAKMHHLVEEISRSAWALSRHVLSNGIACDQESDQWISNVDGQETLIVAWSLQCASARWQV